METATLSNSSSIKMRDLGWIEAHTSSRLKALTVDDIRHIRAKSLEMIPPKKISYIGLKVFEAMSAKQVRSLTWGQVQCLSFDRFLAVASRLPNFEVRFRVIQVNDAERKRIHDALDPSQYESVYGAFTDYVPGHYMSAQDLATRRPALLLALSGLHRDNYEFLNMVLNSLIADLPHHTHLFTTVIRDLLASGRMELSSLKMVFEMLENEPESMVALHKSLDEPWYSDILKVLSNTCRSLLIWAEA